MQRLLILLISAFLILTTGYASDNGDDWLKHVLVYQLYPRSFKDSNGDGIGDLKGITSKLEHIRDVGAQVIWLSPIYSSPQKDFGYDISNFVEINSEYGTLTDFENLTNKAKLLGLKVVLDLVPNHSSSEHEWFKNSVQRIKPYDDYYVWENGKIVNGSRVPPNNWIAGFGGSAWEWNDERKQYYLHQFDASQPDLNYRNERVYTEMENVMKFWIERGVSGFRIDAINHLVEDSRLRDEPPSGNNVSPMDYEYHQHIYTKDLKETYDIMARWRRFLDELAESRNSEKYFILSETYGPLPTIMKFYLSGSNAPMNFAFSYGINRNSSPLQIKETIEQWLTQMPKGYVPNWVTGNHDTRRVATKFGPGREDQMSALAMILPGIAVVYNGDEIGMTDVRLSYEQTLDPRGCNVGPDLYHLYSRDPPRSPYQWDNTTSAGFSSNESTWLPVNKNYRTLNLANQKASTVSHLKVFQDLSALRKSPVLRRGSLEISVLSSDVLAVVRRLKDFSPVVLLLNVSDQSVKIDASLRLNVPDRMPVYTASVHSGLQKSSLLNMKELILPGAATVIFGDKALLYE